jgi:hypothetical protein
MSQESDRREERERVMTESFRATDLLRLHHARTGRFAQMTRHHMGLRKWHGDRPLLLAWAVAR